MSIIVNTAYFLDIYVHEMYYNQRTRTFLEENTMNKQESDVLLAIAQRSFENQRELAAYTGHALGVVNKALNSLEKNGYVDEMKATVKTYKLLDERQPENAIILAAGFGMRMVPINHETPKAFLEVNGEKLIERQISQLHEVGIREIYIVVGFMKEKFEYLIDKYNVELIVNSEYATKNNFHSLYKALNHLQNTYIVPCDVWCDRNPFSRRELYSWYMVSDLIDDESDVRVNRKNELVLTNNGGNAMVGIAYLTGSECERVKERLSLYCHDKMYDNDFWESTLFEKDRMIVTAKVVHASDITEINTYEQLRNLDGQSNQLNSDAIRTIETVFNAKPDDITDITILKKGMTNRSFLFRCKGDKYIMRIPGEGTDQLINRREEADVYQTIGGFHFCDDPVYINPENGYKVTKFLNGVRECDPHNDDDLKRCMELLRRFHDEKLKVKHSFDLFAKMEFYESLWNGSGSMYQDYEETKKNVLKLRVYIDQHKEEYCLTHIDAVPDNFLFYKDVSGAEQLQLTDWEYAGMQDPHVDIAMFCIYSLYDKKQVDHLIGLYFNESCSEEIRTKIYCYIAICGLLWSNWCEYKAHLGVEFGEYSLRQYRYAKEYYRYAVERM